MGQVTTHTEGRVVTHSGDDIGPVEVVQLPNRDAAIAAASPIASALPAATAPATPPKATPAVKAATPQQVVRTKKATKK